MTLSAVGELDDLAAAVIRRLVATASTLAVAETSTGGLLGAVLLRQNRATECLAGSIVAYSQDLQPAWLGIPESEMRRFGAVSPEAAARLAEGVRQRLAATWGLAETGIAGPQTGRRSSKPVGLGYLAIAGPDGVRSADLLTGEDQRIANKQGFAAGALRLLLDCLTES